MNHTNKLNVTIAFKGMDSSDAMKDYAHKRASKLIKHMHHLTNCHFTFLNENHKNIAELHIVSGDFEAKAEAKNENMYAAIDDVTDKALQQSRKHKEKATDHHRGQKPQINTETPEAPPSE